MTFIWVGVGSALGGIFRHGVGLLTALLLGGTPLFPWATLVVNAVGSFLIGLFFVYLSGEKASIAHAEEMKAFLMIGMMGGFTTFSSFSLQTLELTRGGHWGYAGGYVVVSLLLCLLAVTGGVSFGMWISR